MNIVKCEYKLGLVLELLVFNLYINGIWLYDKGGKLY